jgi:hypothetical protein
VIEQWYSTEESYEKAMLYRRHIPKVEFLNGQLGHISNNEGSKIEKEGPDPSWEPALPDTMSDSDDAIDAIVYIKASQPNQDLPRSFNLSPDIPGLGCSHGSPRKRTPPSVKRSRFLHALVLIRARSFSEGDCDITFSRARSLIKENTYRLISSDLVIYDPRKLDPTILCAIPPDGFGV